MPAVRTPLGELQGNPGSVSAGFASADPTKAGDDFAVIMLRPDGRIASWNWAAERVFGLDTAHALGQSFACLYPREAVDAGLPEHDLAAALELGTTVVHEVPRRRSDGTIFRATVSLGAVFGADDSHLGFVEVVQRSERDASPAQRYADSLAKADLVLRSVHDAIVVQDSSGNVLYANDAMATACGLPDGAAMTRTPLEGFPRLLEVFDEQGKPITPLDITFAYDTGAATVEPVLFHVRVRKTNDSRWWLVRRTSLRDEQGRPQLIIHVGSDVTDTVRAREAASSLADATRLLSASLDYATTLRTLAEALVPRLADWAVVILVEEGTPRQVAVAHPDPTLTARARELWERFPVTAERPLSIANVLRTGRARLFPYVNEETLQSFATNEEHLSLLREFQPHSAIFAPIVVCGRTVGVLAFSAVSPRRAYDDADLDLAVELGRRAGNAIEQARLYRDAQRAVHLRDEFLSIAAHELRTPLAALTLQLQSLKMTVSGDALEHDADRFQGRIDKTLRQSNRLARLVDGLLDVSRIAGGQLDLHRQEVDLRTIVSGVCERFAEDAERAGSELSFSNGGPCMGSWDADRLDQVVSNLVSNAIKYGQGKPVEVYCTADGDNGVVTVSDRGIGIAPENLERIFGRFERAVSERNYGGLGLGLWIAQEIAQAHGGRVEVTSTAGEGAVFRLVVPRSSVSAERRHG
ncbi:MAG TPA: ATP-binding protein [Labilithrix sp.]|nr:ATP-binding protein [Labilithrix sp.]